ncbi:MAG: Nif3-like dinuclear metal center hexameric protein [Verrucomicrobiales bacterium]|nr:Nif3-like dinuclear metal center hexameric protein [Verrucomicrobiales bacterium]
MAKLDTVVGYLDKRLKLASVPDYAGALNGLQLRNRGVVKRVAAAVDASLGAVEEAVEAEADLLLVHHGMFWGGVQRIDGALYEKLATAMGAGLAIYSAHLPLDVHEKFGNNVLLAAACGLKAGERFFEWKGIELGLRFETRLELRTLVDRVEKAVGGPANVCAAGGAKAGVVGVITGGAGGEVAAMAAAGIDTFITGEGPHHSYTLAEELGVNVIYAGHYATETFGVRALAAHLATKYKLGAAVYIDRPTGL